MCISPKWVSFSGSGCLSPLLADTWRISPLMARFSGPIPVSPEVLAHKSGETGRHPFQSIGEFILTHPRMRVPEKGKVYSINEGYAKHWSKGLTEYVHTRKFPEEGKKGMAQRYVGSMVADVHRTILNGGIFLYPPTADAPNGKLRLLYECAPMAYLMEHAGGLATTGTMNILDIIPKKIHERAPIYMGSKQDVEELLEFLKKHDQQ